MKCLVTGIDRLSWKDKTSGQKMERLAVQFVRGVPIGGEGCCGLAAMSAQVERAVAIQLASKLFHVWNLECDGDKFREVVAFEYVGPISGFEFSPLGLVEKAK
jgi:hypothetical protein